LIISDQGLGGETGEGTDHRRHALALIRKVLPERSAVRTPVETIKIDQSVSSLERRLN
jgi:hypothetical protein